VFSADWLALREPADVAARSTTLVRAVASMFDGSHTMRALDLACGTGANARYVSDRIGARQDWLLVDYDSALLAQVRACMTVWAASRGARIADDGGELRVTCEGQAPASFKTFLADLRRLDDPSIFEGRVLVTGSALLDLVSESWVRNLAHVCRANGARALFALTYDGRIRCRPEEPEDGRVRRLVNEHQRIDKGFGPALGPTAVDVVERTFGALGYRSGREPSDWIVESGAAELQRQLIAGWTEAATAMAPSEEASIRRWRDRRLSHLDQGRSRLAVGHEDILLWPV
jgi:hypothetical protein